MSTTKFTEGSWRVEWAEDGHGDRFFNVLKNDGDADDYGRMVDASYSIIEMAYPVIDADEAVANAHLIAAAPDLYAALQWCVEIVDEYGWGVNSDAARVNAEATLAYARGEAYRYGEDDS